jgi:hypothetical protein
VAHFELLERHLLDEILVFANLIQIPAVILTGGVAWLLCRPIRRWVWWQLDREIRTRHVRYRPQRRPRRAQLETDFGRGVPGFPETTRP